MQPKEEFTPQTKEEIINYISEQIYNSESWVFIHKKSIGDKMQVCMLSPKEEEALICVMHWLKNDPHLWHSFKKTMEEYL